MRLAHTKILLTLYLLFITNQIYAQNNSEIMNDRIFLKIKSEHFATDLRNDVSRVLDIQAIGQVLTQNNYTEIRTAFPSLDLSASDPYGLERVLVVRIEATQNIVQVIESLNALDEIDYAEPMYIRELYQTEILPNDTYFNQSWHHPVVNTPAAWDIQTGSDTIIIAIIDTGVDTDHPDLIDNLWNNPGEIADNNIDDDNNGKVDDIYGWDFTQNDADVNHEWEWHPYNAEDHGTHCAGIAAGVSNNNIGITGASHHSKIMTCKIFPYLSDASAANAIVYAADNGAHVISNSWGGGGSSATIQAAILHARNVRDAVVLFASGNDNTASPSYPGANDGVVCVGATNSSDTRASFSNYGTWVDMCAPGTGIWSCTDPENPAHNNEYEAWDGTSMATPLVAGIAALIRSQYPYMNVEGVETRLLDGDDVGNVQMGLRVNALKALNAFNIAHQPIDNIMDPSESIEFSAGIYSSAISRLSVTVNFSISGGPMTTLPMLEVSPGSWAMTLEPLPGGSVVEYYIEARGGADDQAFHPLTAPETPHFFLIGGPEYFNTISFEDAELESDWSLGLATDDASTGIWIQDDPVGTFEGTEPVQPEDNHTPNGSICFVTGNAEFTGENSGSGDVDGGMTTLESPVFNIPPDIIPILSYWRWYTNNLGFNPGTDTWLVQIRDQESPWINIEETSNSDNRWTEHVFYLNHYFEAASSIQLRFIADDASPGSLVEAAVDDIHLFHAGGIPFMLGDVYRDGQINVQDVILLIEHILGNSTLVGNALQAADFNEDDQIDIEDVVDLMSAILSE